MVTTTKKNLLIKHHYRSGNFPQCRQSSLISAAEQFVQTITPISVTIPSDSRPLGGSWNCRNWKMCFWMAWWQIKPGELYFDHSLPDAISVLQKKTAALLFVTPILGLFSCCVLTPCLQRRHQVVLVTCAGHKHYQMNQVVAEKCSVRL